MHLSIIVPCFNSAASIGPLLADISGQLDGQCELILINDGSTDDTSARIARFIAAYAGPGRIVLKDTANAGAAKARECGLSLATGTFVYFCDSDDLFQSGFIATFNGYLQRFPALDVFFFSSDIAVETEAGELRRVSAKVCYEQPRSFSPGAGLLSYNLAAGMYTAAVWTFIFRRALARQTGAAFTHRSAHEDHLFTLKIILGAGLIVAAPELLYIQKTRQGSLTNSRKSVSYLTDRIEAYYEARRCLATAGFADHAAYDRWSFDSVLQILRGSPELWQGLLRSGTGRRYLLQHAAALAALLARKAIRRLGRALGWRREYRERA